MLKITNLHSFYGKSHIIQGLSLEVNKGEIVSLLGRNGVGRSTTIKSIMGMVKANGSIKFENKEILGKQIHEISNLGLAYVSEHRDIFPDLTVLENLELGKKNNFSENPWNIEELFGLFPNLENRKNVPGGVLSGGEQQMLTISRSLLGNPKLIMIDEPTEGLSPKMVENVETLLKKISSVQIWKELYKNTFFYQNYFQEVGLAEKELEKNIKESIIKIYYWISAEGFKNNIKTSNNKESSLLEGLSYPTKPLSWLSNTDIEYLCKEFKKSGFRGPLNRYRNQHKDWVDLPELSNLKISSPSLFIGGEYDPVRFFIKNYDSYENPGKLCSNFFGAHIVKDCGHWVQQEKPEQVNGIIKNFLEKIS